MKRNIAIIGTGYVGLTTGVCFAYLGHQVICVDKDEEKIKKLKKGEVPIFEPGLEDLLKEYKRNISFTTKTKDVVEKSEVIFICVGTPAKKDGRIEMKYFNQAVREIGEVMRNMGDNKKRKIIVNKSTVPVGTGKHVKETIKKYYNGEFSVVSNPEFLREGSAIKDFLEPDRIVIGVEDDYSKEVMLDIYSSIKAPKVICNIKSAEMIKYASNAFLATKISFINEIANICERTGADVEKVAEGMGLDRRIGSAFLKAGIGYGGSCFPKDIEGLNFIANSHSYDFKLLKSVKEINEYQQRKFVNEVKKVLRKISGNLIAVWGLSFKPNTDDVRKSPAIKIVRRLQKSNFKIQVYDPIATKNAQKELGGKNIKYCKSALSSVRKADILLLLTDWPEFSEIDMGKVKKLMKNYYIFDGRNQLDPETVKKLGFYYRGVGRN